MSRKLRIEYPGAMYHVINRGDQREDIFRDDEDRLRLLSRLGEACGKTEWQVHAYCLMRNHFHLEADLQGRRQGEPRKVELAWDLRSKTAMPLAGMAERLQMGSRVHLAWLLQQRGKSQLAAPANQSLLRI